MIHLRLRTEFSFRRAFGRPKQVLAVAGGNSAAITDGGTWGHVSWYKACKEAGVKPIYGVELYTVQDARDRTKQGGVMMAFLARNNEGLKELYQLVSRANELFYYVPRIDYRDVNGVSPDIIVLTGSGAIIEKLTPRPNVYLELSPANSVHNRRVAAAAKGWNRVVTCDNFYPTIAEKGAYEIIAGRERRARTTAMHILSREELELAIPEATAEDFLNNERIAADCNATLPKAEMVKPERPASLRDMCLEGAFQRGVAKYIEVCDGERVVQMNSEDYRARMDRELGMIEEKQFEDYFYVITDMVQEAKKVMFVGPARGSSAGSLVCYLLGITDVDPLVHDLMFERFIDITRADLPDIDIDFPDNKRELVIEQLKRKYGASRVGRIGTVARYKAKSCLGDVAKQLNIPVWEMADVKDAVVERSTGDARAQFCIKDALEGLDIGKALLVKYPALAIASELEGHATHSGTHAAGVIVANEPITNYCSISKDGAAQIDKKDAETLNMLKIDALGLRTLSVLQDALDQIEKPREWLITYPLTDTLAFEVFNAERYSGIFQFEGYALQSLCRQMKIRDFEDISAIGALARPGPLHCGAATEYIARRIGSAPVVHMHATVAPLTAPTYGTVIYQEQVMAIGRAVGDLSWEDVSELRKAMSKSLGEEFFNKYWVKFEEGAARVHKMPSPEARRIWDKMCTFGCLSGDIIIKLPTSNQYSPQELTLRELYKRGGYAQPAADVTNRAAQRKRGKAKVLNMQDGAIVPAQLIDIYESGVKDTWRLVTKEGHVINATQDHRFLTQDRDWQPLSAIIPSDVIAVSGRSISSMRKLKGTGSGRHNPWHGQSKLFVERVKTLQATVKECQRCFKAPYQETHHRDCDRLNNDWDNLFPVCRKCHKALHRELGQPMPTRWSRGLSIEWVAVESISEPRREMTYDIAMSRPHNNFIANGFVVHNSWAFNKSHAISYGLLSYWCAVLKAHYPLEFAAACLRNAKDEEQSIKMLRELVKEGFEYKPVDIDKSTLYWSVVDGKLLGGLTNIKGLGAKKAQDILTRRSEHRPLQPGHIKLLANPVTPYDDIFEGKRRFGDIYVNPKNYNILSGAVTPVANIGDAGEYVFIARIKEKNLRDLNEYGNLVKRGGRRIAKNSIFLNLVLEDDSGSIIAKVGREQYPKWGKPLIEEAKIGDWFIWKGRIKDDGWRLLMIGRWRTLEQRTEQMVAS